MTYPTRKQALESNDKFYQGRPCRQGHKGVRYTKSKHCVKCQHNHYRRWKDSLGSEFKKTIKERQRKWIGLPDPTRPEPEECECCGVTQANALALDHDHDTGKFRGWLCTNCNWAIGRLGDDLASVMKAINYLQRNA